MGQNQTENGLEIERYLRGELSDDEETAFEEAYLGSEELLDQLELADSLGRGMRDIATLEKSNPGKARSGWMPALLRSPQYAMAASLLLVVSLGISGVMYQRVNELGDPLASHAAAPAQIVPLVAVRANPGDEPVNIINLDPDVSNFVLMLDPGFEPYSHFRATVTEAGPEQDRPVIFQADHLTPGYEDMLALSVPAPLLAPGDYEIHVEGVRGDKAAKQAFSTVNKLTLRVLPFE